MLRSSFSKCSHLQMEKLGQGRHSQRCLHHLHEKKKGHLGWSWWLMSIIPALDSCKQENGEFKTTLSFGESLRQARDTETLSPSPKKGMEM